MNKGDLISREALIRKIRALAADVIFRGTRVAITAKESCNPVEWTKGFEQGVIDAATIIAGQPAIDAEEVVHGRWITHNRGDSNWVECSECNTAGSPFWKCCPVCTARMDGE